MGRHVLKPRGRNDSLRVPALVRPPIPRRGRRRATPVAADATAGQVTPWSRHPAGLAAPLDLRQPSRGKSWCSNPSSGHFPNDAALRAGGIATGSGTSENAGHFQRPRPQGEAPAVRVLRVGSTGFAGAVDNQPRSWLAAWSELVGLVFGVRGLRRKRERRGPHPFFSRAARRPTRSVKVSAMPRSIGSSHPPNSPSSRPERHGQVGPRWMRTVSNSDVRRSAIRPEHPTIRFGSPSARTQGTCCEPVG